MGRGWFREWGLCPSRRSGASGLRVNGAGDGVLVSAAILYSASTSPRVLNVSFPLAWPRPLLVNMTFVPLGLGHEALTQGSLQHLKKEMNNGVGSVKALREINI